MSEPKNIERRAATFLRQGVMLSAGLFLLGLLIVQVGYFWQLQMPLIVSAVYLLVIEMAAGLVWKRVASKSLDSMPTFLMGLSGVRFLLAIGVLFFYWLLSGGEKMLTFICVFAVFYFAMLLHHIFFFSLRNKTEKDSQRKPNDLQNERQ